MRFSSLLCEFKDEKNKKGELVVEKYISLGRVSFWITFGIMTSFWFADRIVPNSLQDVFLIMVLYNFFKKTLSTMEGVDFKELFKRHG